MNRIKKVWNENRVLLVLGIILVICATIIILVTLKSLSSKSGDVYGTRLESIKNNKISTKLLDNIKDTLEKNEDMEKVNTIQKGKNIYINIISTKDANIDLLKEESAKVLELFKEEELKLYDIEIAITNNSEDEKELFSIMGARNKAGSGALVWDNRNLEALKEKESTE